MIDRDTMIVQSITDFLRNALFNERGFTADQVEILDEFPYSRFGDTALDKEYIALGFNFDSNGTALEMGSSLITRPITIEFWLFATTPQRGESLAGHVKHALEENGVFPLKDYNQAGDPVIDQLQEDGVHRERQPHPNPEPWQENAWTITLRVEDVYYTSQV